MLMMNIVVLGAGLMGKEAVRDLIQNERVKTVYLADREVNEAKKFVHTLATNRVVVVQLDARDEQSLTELIQRGDIVINALFYTFNEIVAKIAIEVGTHYVDLGGHIGGATKKVLAMHDRALEKEVTVIPDLGVAPGMMNILAGYGAEQLDDLTSIRIFVGGVPAYPKPPLEYAVVFSLDGVFDHYTEPSTIIRNGQRQMLPSLSEIETINFDQLGQFEAFHTSGGTSTLLDTYAHLETLEYKTIRYEGHAKKFQLLVDLGLLNKENRVTLNNQEISVRDVMREHFMSLLALEDDEDLVLLKVLVSGRKAQIPTTHTYELIAKKEMENHITAMARVTASTISIVAQMIGEGVIQKRGVWPPEQIVPGDIYIRSLEKRRLEVREYEE